MSELPPNEQPRSGRQLTTQRSPQEQVNFLRALWDRAVVTGRLFFDARVPLITKVIPAAALAYLFVPVDIIPELLVPVIGPLVALDDLTLLAVSLGLFIQAAPPDIVQEHLREIGSPLAEPFGAGPDPIDEVEGEVVSEEVIDDNMSDAQRPNS